VNFILARTEQEEAAPSSIVRRFLVWAQATDPGERADAASALAQAYRYSNFPEDIRREAVIALTALLDDKSTLVRRALAEALASADDAPRHIVLALAQDLPEVAAIMVARSPVLNDADLVDCAAIGDDYVQIELARRAPLGIGAAAALAEVGCRDAALALLENQDAHVTAIALRRIAERFGADGAIREALLERAWLPASLRCDLVAATAQALSPLAAAFGLGAHRIERLMRDACEEGAILVAGDAVGDDLTRLILHLRDSGGLTVSLLIRGLVAGDSAFFEAAVSELSGFPAARVSAFVRAPHGSGFAALYRRTGLPIHYFPAFRAGLAAVAELSPALKGQAARQISAKIIAACEAEADSGLDRLVSLLRRLEVQGALQEARAFAAKVVAGEGRASHKPPPIPRVVLEPAFEEPPSLLITLTGDEQAELSGELIEAPIEETAEAQLALSEPPLSEETAELAEAPLALSAPPLIEETAELAGAPPALPERQPIEETADLTETPAAPSERPSIDKKPELAKARPELPELPPIAWKPEQAKAALELREEEDVAEFAEALSEIIGHKVTEPTGRVAQAA
jgi:uncharacterized protein (DUF2336 family)